MGKPEGIVEDYLITQSKKHNCLCYKFTSPGRRGVPDRIIIGYGQVHFVELKSATGSLSEQQKKVINTMKQHGATISVISSKEETDIFFKNLSETKPKYITLPWIYTDSDSYQHVRPIILPEDLTRKNQIYMTYHCIQIEKDINDTYRVMSNIIDINDYSLGEIKSVMSAYYDDLFDPLKTITEGNQTNRTLNTALCEYTQILAECLFESSNDNITIQKNLSWNDAVNIISSITTT